LIKRKGKFEEVATGVGRGRALDIGAGLTAKGLAATFKIVPVKGKARLTRRTGEFTRFREAFRAFKIKKGKKIPLIDEFIQKRGKRLITKAERRAIQRARMKASIIGGKSNFIK
jgi:hypothetical protein